MYTLVIGNYNYSSWSMRAWRMLKASKVEGKIVRIPIYTDGYKEKILEYSPAGRVPALIDDTLPDKQAVWDSLAIMEHVLERNPDTAIGWPKDAAAQAMARSICYEMHAGFLAIRDELPQNLRARNTLDYDKT